MSPYLFGYNDGRFNVSLTSPKLDTKLVVVSLSIVENDTLVTHLMAYQNRSMDYFLIWSLVNDPVFQCIKSTIAIT